MIFSAPIYDDVLNSIWGRYEQIFLRMVASVKNWVNKTRRLIKMSALPLKLANIQKRYTCYSFLKWSVESPLLWYWFPRNAHIFCSWSAISFVRFCAFFAWFAQNWKYFAKCNFFATRVVANWPKFTVSAQNQLIKGLLKNLHANKLWSCYSKLLSFSYIKSSNWGTKINKTEIRIWKLNFDAKFL